MIEQSNSVTHRRMSNELMCNHGRWAENCFRCVVSRFSSG
jgi:hypothetical protein